MDSTSEEENGLDCIEKRSRRSIASALAKYSRLSIGGPTLVRITESIGNQDLRMTLGLSQLIDDQWQWLPNLVNEAILDNAFLIAMNADLPQVFFDESLEAFAFLVFFSIHCCPK